MHCGCGEFDSRLLHHGFVVFNGSTLGWQSRSRGSIPRRSTTAKADGVAPADKSGASMGSSSNGKMRASHVRDPGSIPGGSTTCLCSSVAERLFRNQPTGVRFPSQAPMSAWFSGRIRSWYDRDARSIRAAGSSAGEAQVVEHLFCKQAEAGSIPVVSSVDNVAAAC